MTTKSYIVTKDKAQTLTNKGIDADSNLITNLEVGNIKAAAVSTAIPASGAVDTKLTTEKAVADGLDAKLGKQYTAAEDGYLAVVDDVDHVLKPLPRSTTTCMWGDLTGEPTDNNKFVSAMALKQDVANMVTTMQAVPDNTHYPSEKLLSDSLAPKQDVANLVTTFQSTPDNTHYPSEKLVKDTLDAKQDISNIVQTVSSSSTASTYPSAQAVYNHVIGNIENTLTSSDATKSLSAYQGKTLQDGKIDKTAITDTDTTVSGDTLWSSQYLKDKFAAVSGVTRTEVVPTLPESPVNNTMYYVGTASPYHIYLRANDTTYDMGTTEIDLSSYIKNTSIVDNLTTDDNTKVLSAKQGKVLEDNKQTKANLVSAFQSVPDDTHYPSEKLAYDQLELKQTKANLVTAFQPTPDDTHYPSEKLVYDELKDLFDMIYPIGSYAFGVRPGLGTWAEVVGDCALWLKNTAADGTYIDEALPNITGTMKYIQGAGSRSTIDPQGCFVDTTYMDGWAGANSSNGRYNVKFDASDSNSIYQDGAHVQPNAYVMKVYQRIA